MMNHPLPRILLIGGAFTVLLGAFAFSLSGAKPQAGAHAPHQSRLDGQTPMKIEIKKDKVIRTENEWRQALTPEQFNIMREKGTERAFTGKYWDTTEPGLYKCAGCGQILFNSQSKFESHCGWPSFDKAFADGTITEHADTSFGMVRTEVTCTRCGAHLGHVFPDGPTDTGLRYCINSASIDLQEMDNPPEASTTP